MSWKKNFYHKISYGEQCFTLKILWIFWNKRILLVKSNYLHCYDVYENGKFRFFCHYFSFYDFGFTKIIFSTILMAGETSVGNNSREILGWGKMAGGFWQGKTSGEILTISPRWGWDFSKTFNHFSAKIYQGLTIQNVFKMLNIKAMGKFFWNRLLDFVSYLFHFLF